MQRYEEFGMFQTFSAFFFENIFSTCLGKFKSVRQGAVREGEKLCATSRYAKARNTKCKARNSKCKARCTGWGVNTNYRELTVNFHEFFGNTEDTEVL